MQLQVNPNGNRTISRYFAWKKNLQVFSVEIMCRSCIRKRAFRDYRNCIQNVENWPSNIPEDILPGAAYITNGEEFFYNCESFLEHDIAGVSKLDVDYFKNASITFTISTNKSGDYEFRIQLYLSNIWVMEEPKLPNPNDHWDIPKHGRRDSVEFDNQIYIAHIKQLSGSRLRGKKIIGAILGHQNIFTGLPEHGLRGGYKGLYYPSFVIKSVEEMKPSCLIFR